MFFSLALVFGAIMLIDNIQENSPKAKRQEEQARINAERYVQALMERVEREAEEKIQRWKDKGLPIEKMR